MRNSAIKKIINSIFPQLWPKLIHYKFYLSNPHAFVNDLKIKSRIPTANKKKISFHEPNFIYYGQFSKNSTIVDIGCGFKADFSVHLINKFGVTAFGFDPTHKHKSQLKEIEQTTNGRFKHCEYALAPEKGKIVFNESEQSESGSLLNDHVNILKDDINRYEVETISLKEIPRLINSYTIDLIKIDAEGVEYEILKNITSEDLKCYKQVFVEFHHFAIEKYTENDTSEVVSRMENIGFQYYTIDDINYLFYKTEMSN